MSLTTWKKQTINLSLGFLGNHQEGHTYGCFKEMEKVMTFHLLVLEPPAKIDFPPLGVI